MVRLSSQSSSALLLIVLCVFTAAEAPGSHDVETGAAQGECSSTSGSEKGTNGSKKTKKTCRMEEGVDYPGGVCNEEICTGSDLEFIKDVPSPKKCCSRCHKHPTCVYWTYANASRRPQWQRLGCWLKTIDAGPTR